jgi:hypothetical protein
MVVTRVTSLLVHSKFREICIAEASITPSPSFSDLYTAVGSLILDSSAEKIWILSADFKYPNENEVTIYEYYQIYAACKYFLLLQ